MPTPIRYSYGVSTETAGALKDFGLPNPAKWHVFFEDFDKYKVGDWTITTVEAGASSATEALTDADGGVLLLTNDSADDDSDFFQLVGESFKFEAGKRLIFQSRFYVSDETQTDAIMGLIIRDTTPLGNTDGVHFRKIDNDTELYLYVTKDSTSTTAALGHTFVDNAFVTVGYEYNGKGEIKYFLNGVHVGSLTPTTLPDDEVLAVSFGIQNGNAASRSMGIDYVLVAKER